MIRPGMGRKPTGRPRGRRKIAGRVEVALRLDEHHLDELREVARMRVEPGRRPDVSGAARDALDVGLPVVRRKARRKGRTT